jgi:hypothetical protein
LLLYEKILSRKKQLYATDFGKQDFRNDNTLVFTKAFLKTDHVIFGNYTEHKAYTLDANNSPVNFSSTICI